MTMKDLTQRLAEEEAWKERSKAKTINYDFLTDEHNE